MSGWILAYDGFDPRQQPLREALCTLGNGCFATRGAHEEAGADGVHYPGTYLAGGYNRLRTEIAGRTVENEDLVNFPNWLPLSFRHEGGEWLDLAAAEILAYRQELDLAKGLLGRSMVLRDGDGRETELTSRRLVHMALPHLAALHWTIRPLNWSGTIEIRSALDGRVTNDGVARYRALDGRHLAPLATAEPDAETILLTVETVQSHLRMSQAARTRLFRDDAAIPAERATRHAEGFVEQILRVGVEQGAPLEVEKVVALFHSRSRAISEPARAAETALAEAGGFDDLLGSHALAWDHLWRRCDVEIDGDGRRQMVLRLHIFHLLQSVSPNSIDLDVGVPARGLHGEAYRGHIFWDELFIFPLLNLRIPEITRSLLRYRHRRLPAARRLARAAGFAGAMYPWQSGSSGREETQTLHLNPKSGRWLPDNTHLQRHSNAAIAHNVWRYFEATNDTDFLSFHGAEMLLEIARFWASIAAFDEAKGRYVIRGVMGPDEFHDRYPWAERPGLDNNAYTNVMAAWVMAKALEALGRIDPEQRSELTERLGLDSAETARWDEISRRMFVPFHDGLISQFEQYERLEELDWEGYRQRYGDIHRLDRILEAEGDSVNRYKASKQADVLMLFYLFSAEEFGALMERLGYAFDSATIPATVDYYLARTSNGSTLSGVVHAWVLARSDRARSWTLFEEALESDIADVQGGTTAEGIHLGAMAGTVDIVQRAYLGVELVGERLRLDPFLPPGLGRLRLRLRHRGCWLEVEMNEERLTLAAPGGWEGPAELIVRNSALSFGPGETIVLPSAREDGGWRPVPDPAARDWRPA